MTLSRAKEIVSQFSSKKILVVGDVMLDRYVFGKVERLNPEAPVPILHARSEKSATGGAGNVAKNTAMLGAQTTLISVVGSDQAAGHVEDAARAEGYEPHFVSDAKRPTIEKIRYLVGSQQMLRVDYEDKDDIQKKIEAELMAILQEVSAGVDAVIVSDYAKGTITKKIVEAVFAAAKGKWIAADVKPSHAAYFVGASMISPNRKEAHEFLGLNPLEHKDKTASELAKLLHVKMKTEAYITLGAEGMYVFANEKTRGLVHQDHAVEVFDVSGAGDTAMAAITLARLCGATPLEAAAIGNAAGAVVVSKIGAAGLTSDELLNMIAHKHE